MNPHPTASSAGGSASRTPAQVLREARRRDSRTKRARVLDAVQEMARHGDRITFAAVARAANLSTWLTCADGVHEHIESAITVRDVDVDLGPSVSQDLTLEDTRVSCQN